MGPATEMSGGSAGNTVAGLVSLGGTGAYFGKVADDQLGRIFAHDIRSLGIRYETAPLADTPPTARSMILVTPDGERSMNTYLGACVELSPDDVVEEIVAAARVTYFEGYSGPAARQGRDRGSREDRPRQRARGRDDAVGQFLRPPLPRRVPRPHALGHRRHRLRQRAEALALYQTEILEEALHHLGQDAKRLAIVTRGADGCVVVEDASRQAFPATVVPDVVDTTGAGDLFASGFLRGYTAGLPTTSPPASAPSPPATSSPRSARAPRPRSPTCRRSARSWGRCGWDIAGAAAPVPLGAWRPRTPAFI